MSDTAVSSTCLVLMLKAPDRSKRRLAAEMGRSAADAADRLSACAIEDMRHWRGFRCFAPAEAADGEWLAGRALPEGAEIRQQGENLGARINHVNRELCKLGWPRQIFIGVDCPRLDQSYLERAASALTRHDAVLGPAVDGGVVLMGARRPWPELTGLPWSTAALRDALRSTCEAAGWSVATLEPLTDVDRFEDLAPLERSLRGDPRPARRALREWVLELDTEPR
ncbi:MAG: DUF2064 domain-containing protein [Gammaproteobacteria bacterium]|nr:DUF2064 domain-containing protein [Gammaproteobacteria bacterium]